VNGEKGEVSDVLKDIRDLSDNTEEYRDELTKRWSSLLSYRYIGRNHGSMNTGPVDNTVALRHDMRNAAGGLMVAPISISSPEGGGRTDMVAVPNPVIHSCQILDDARDVQRIEIISSQVLKEGKTMDFSRSKIVDADNHDRVIAYTEGQGVSIGTPPPGLGKMDLEEPTIAVVDSPDLPPLWKVFGASRRDDGHWILPELAIELASPDAALHLGPQHIVLETAAIDAAAQLVGTDRLQIETWHVMFLARGKVGPFRVEGEADRGRDGRVGVRMTLHDEGNGGRAITSGSAVFHIVG
jgi:hypothetical protein